MHSSSKWLPETCEMLALVWLDLIDQALTARVMATAASELQSVARLTGTDGKSGFESEEDTAKEASVAPLTSAAPVVCKKLSKSSTNTVVAPFEPMATVAFQRTWSSSFAMSTDQRARMVAVAF